MNFHCRLTYTRQTMYITLALATISPILTMAVQILTQTLSLLKVPRALRILRVLPLKYRSRNHFISLISFSIIGLLYIRFEVLTDKAEKRTLSSGIWWRLSASVWLLQHNNWICYYWVAPPTPLLHNRYKKRDSTSILRRQMSVACKVYCNLISERATKEI